MSENDTSSGGCFGCIGTILFFFLVWFLVFGLTLNGIKYEVDCNTKNGIEINQKTGKKK